jgi:hypothetical protein
MKYEILKRQISFREAAEYVRKNCREYYEVPPGFKLFDIHIIGVPPILVGIDGPLITFPYTKPCHGTFLLRLSGESEVARIKKEGKKVR